jgi:hypothetical protein
MPKKEEKVSNFGARKIKIKGFIVQLLSFNCLCASRNEQTFIISFHGSYLRAVNYIHNKKTNIWKNKFNQWEKQMMMMVLYAVEDMCVCSEREERKEWKKVWQYYT